MKTSFQIAEREDFIKRSKSVVNKSVHLSLFQMIG